MRVKKRREEKRREEKRREERVMMKRYHNSIDMVEGG